MKSIRLMLAGASLLLLCSCGAQVQKETQVANANESKENTVIETIMSRRSIRQYKPQAVNRDTMQIILIAVSMHPTDRTSNRGKCV